LLYDRLFVLDPAHSGIAAAAVLWTLGQGLGDASTPPVEAAWTEAYTIPATVMKDAAA
jgi:hemoglobin-like flavoprotein